MPCWVWFIQNVVTMSEQKSDCYCTPQILFCLQGICFIGLFTWQPLQVFSLYFRVSVAIFHINVFLHISVLFVCKLLGISAYNIHSFCASLPVEFDDCAGNEDVQFEVSDPSFHVDRDLNLVPQRDVSNISPVLFIHGLSRHADDMAQVEVTGLPRQSPHRLRVSRNCCNCWWCVWPCGCVCMFKFHCLQFIKTEKVVFH